MNKKEFVLRVNQLGQRRIPFLFIIDFEFEMPILFQLDSIDPSKLLYDINGITNQSTAKAINPSIRRYNEISFDEYKKKFSLVYNHLTYGDSYLTNLTVKTPVKLSHSLRELYFATSAKYKLLYNEQFLVFSPECFVRINDGMIFSYPMKGTIDAAVPNAAEIILRDTKELAEHVTIVDLIRNDLSLVAGNVSVTRFRYIDEIKTRTGKLLQVSSEIRGELEQGYYARLGDILFALLPAGSVSGAPKQKTLEIIRAAEQEKRGFYTGIFGYFDGTRLDSGVMIRFIENSNAGTFYRSGGGITTQSVAEKEYQEVLDKVYVPVD